MTDLHGIINNKTNIILDNINLHFASQWDLTCIKKIYLIVLVFSFLPGGCKRTPLHLAADAYGLKPTTSRDLCRLSTCVFRCCGERRMLTLRFLVHDRNYSTLIRCCKDSGLPLGNHEYLLRPNRYLRISSQYRFCEDWRSLALTFDKIIEIFSSKIQIH